ncbi:MAG: AsmA family protein, partial [Lysobacterales bacterium]
MKRALKYLLSMLAAIVVLCIVMGAWLIHDGDWIRAKSGEYVSRITGRQFSIDGPLDINLSLHPTVSAQDLRLSNASWAGDTDLARLKKLRFSVDFLSLFSDQVVFNFIELEG